MPTTTTNQTTIETPEWFETTPDETNYCLLMTEGGGGNLQEIDLDRDEFIALKAELARNRGIASEEAPQPAGARDYEPGGHTCNDILTAVDALESAGACHMAYCRFFKDAEPAELRWLAGVLTLRIEDPRLRLSECAENHVRPYFAGPKPTEGTDGSGEGSKPV